MGMKTPTGNPLEVYLAFDPEKHWKVIESDTAPFIADDKNPEWYIKQSEYDALVEAKNALEAENVKLLKYAQAHIEWEAGIIEDGNETLIADLAGTSYGGYYAHEIQQLRAAALKPLAAREVAK